MSEKIEKLKLKPKLELTKSRRQALEDLKETLIGLMGADLSDDIKDKMQELIDAVEAEMLGVVGTENNPVGKWSRYQMLLPSKRH